MIIAGPCQIESLEHSLKIASYLKNICSRLNLPLVFKSSFDKANRSSLQGKRGVGIQEGLKILQRVKDELELSVITDIHSPEQAKIAAEVVDVLQIPAFLCRQTDLLQAAGVTGKAVNIKKGQFLHPADMKYCAEKVAHTGNNNILLCERGTSFGYRDLVVDFRSFYTMAESGYPIVFDATHSVQNMGGEGKGASGGKREYAVPLMRAALTAGVSGLFFECHDKPSMAPSDSAIMLDLETVADCLPKLRDLHLFLQNKQS